MSHVVAFIDLTVSGSENGPTMQYMCDSLPFPPTTILQCQTLSEVDPYHVFKSNPNRSPIVLNQVIHYLLLITVSNGHQISIIVLTVRLKIEESTSFITVVIIRFNEQKTGFVLNKTLSSASDLGVSMQKEHNMA